MTALATRKGPTSPTVPLAATTAASEDEEIQREFREFREAAVRLAERVRDLQATSDPDPLSAARADLHLVRTIFGKWSSDVLVALHALPSAGFEELRRNLTGISPRVLSLKLKELEENGMLRREILDSRPPRVRYSLTERGWTVAWLSQPVLLYLRYTDRTRLPAIEADSSSGGRIPSEAAVPNAGRRSVPPDFVELPAAGLSPRSRGLPIGRSRVGTAGL